MTTSTIFNKIEIQDDPRIELKKLSPKSSEQIDKRDIFHTRKALLQRSCDKYRHSYYRAEHYILFGSDTRVSNLMRHYFTWQGKLYEVVVPYKAGSNSWGYLIGAKNNSLQEEDCKNCRREDIEKIILQVRHPLERLVSTYKYLFSEEGWWQNAYNPILNYTSDSLNNYLDDNRVSWLEFVTEFVLKSSFNRKFSLEVMRDGLSERKFEPLLFAHWAPYWFLNGACKEDIFPDYIFKLETIDEDFNRLKPLLNFPADLRITKVKPQGLTNPHLTPETSDLARELYTQLTKSQVEELYEVYKLDHEMFGYSPEKYINFAK